MPYSVNTTSGVVDSFNTNFGRNIKEFGAPIALLAVKPGTILDAAARVDLKATLNTMAKSAVRANRLYAFFGLVGWEEANGDPKTSSLPNGLTKYNGDGKPVYTLRYDGGGIAQHKLMRKMKNKHKTFDFFIVHEGGEIGGVVVKNTNGSFDLAAIKFHQIWAMKRTLANGNDCESTGMYFVMNNTKQLNENYGWIDTDFDVEEATKGFVDVRIVATNISSTKWKLELLAGETSEDLSAYFPTELAVAGAYVVKNLTTAATLTPSGVALVTGGFELTFSAITSTNKLTFDLAAPAALAALASPVVGYESVGPLAMTQP
jgi:hypothetical protein